MVLIRDAEQRDIPFLWEMLYQSMRKPEGDNRSRTDILDDPFIAKYIDGWGRRGDIGLIVEQNAEQIGAAWLRLFTEESKGFGYLDDVTPEICIAITEKCRGGGIGSALMKEIENRAKDHGYQKLCLSVYPENPARRWYEKLGYDYVEWSDAFSAWTMLKELT